MLDDFLFVGSVEFGRVGSLEAVEVLVGGEIPAEFQDVVPPRQLVVYLEGPCPGANGDPGFT